MFQETTSEVTLHQFNQDVYLKYFTSNINGPTKTTICIFLSEKKGEAAIASYEINGNFSMPEIKMVYSKNGLTCYEWASQDNCLITYQYGDSKIKAYPNVFFDQSDDTLLYPVAKQEFMTKDWRRVHSFAEILLKNNDAEAREILQRYASGSFTTEEIDQNEKSNSVTPNQIQTFSDSLLLKYK